MAPRPSFQFYPGDIRRDMGWRRLSLAAKGLWIELMCVMHDGEPYGHLASNNGEPIPDDEAARLVGAGEKEYVKLLAEIEARGVSSRTESKVLYSRRMVRDEAARQKRAAGGPLSQAHPNVPKKKDPSSTSRKIGSKGQGVRYPSEDPHPPSFGGSPSSSSSSSLPPNPPGGGYRPPGPDGDLAARQGQFAKLLDGAVVSIDHDQGRQAVRRFLDEQRVAPERFASWSRRIAGWTQGLATSGGKAVPWAAIAIGVNDLLDVNPPGKIIAPKALLLFAEGAVPLLGQHSDDDEAEWAALKARAERGEFAA